MAFIVDTLRSFRELYIYSVNPNEYTKQVYKNVQVAGAIALDLLEEFEKERVMKYERTD